LNLKDKKMNSMTHKKMVPDIQVFFTNNKNKTWFLAITTEYPKFKFVKMNRTSKGYSFNDVLKINNVVATISMGYHLDYMSSEELRAIDEYLEENYLAKNIYNEAVKNTFTADDIPF